MNDINHGVTCYISSCKHHTGDHSCALKTISVGSALSALNAIDSPTGTAACENYEPR